MRFASASSTLKIVCWRKILLDYRIMASHVARIRRTTKNIQLWASIDASSAIRTKKIAFASTILSFSYSSPGEKSEKWVWYLAFEMQTCLLCIFTLWEKPRYVSYPSLPQITINHRASDTFWQAQLIWTYKKKRVIQVALMVCIFVLKGCSLASFGLYTRILFPPT